ncbi:MAG: 4-aminobutyrate--2-oxoglutarate transaminase [Steroidobacteraceae bacterium]
MSLTSELTARRNRAIPRGLATATPFFIDRACNAEVWDVDGRRLIDFAAGIAVLNTGHSHPRIVAAVQRQMDHYAHTAIQVIAYEPYIALAEKLNALAPVAQPAKTLFFSTGAEAVENAIKIARCATGRSAVIAFGGAFHGRTLLTLSLTGKTLPYKDGFGPMVPEVFRIPFPVPHFGVRVEDSLHALQALFKNDIAAHRVAAIIVEPVQGEGGFHPAPAELLTGLRQVCDEHGILLIADEIQAGFGRTGKMFAIEHAGVQPDIVTMAKSLAGGMPLSAVTGRAAIMDAPLPGGLGGTYAGSPPACAAALEVLAIMEDEKLLERAVTLGQHTRQRLLAMARRTDLLPVGHIRGRGSMLGFDLLQAHGSDQVAVGKAAEITKRAHARGLILLSCGTYSESIRLLYPLTIQTEVLDEGLTLLESALTPD